jgi:hypothetical protein
MESTVARSLWQVYEPYHQLCYFAPEARAATDRLGLKGGWMGYFAARAAPLGPVPAELVIATFYNFHPEMVRRAIPEAWSLASPAALLEAQLGALDAVLLRLLGPAVLSSPVLAEAAGLARRAAEACDLGGRPLGAANAALPRPTEPHLALWSATTRLREHRGDGHVACLLAAGIDPCQAHVVQVAAGRAAAETQRRNRWWSEADWQAAEDGLRARGWLASDGSLTPTGRAGRTQIERGTDELALRPWQTLGLERSERLWRLLNDLSCRLVEQGGLPLPNPSGLSWPPAWNAAPPAE